MKAGAGMLAWPVALMAHEVLRAPGCGQAPCSTSAPAEGDLPCSSAPGPAGSSIPPIDRHFAPGGEELPVLTQQQGGPGASEEPT